MYADNPIFVAKAAYERFMVRFDVLMRYGEIYPADKAIDRLDILLVEVRRCMRVLEGDSSVESLHDYAHEEL